MFIGLQEIYLLVDPKGYPFVPITEPSEEYLKAESNSFVNLHEQNQYVIKLALSLFTNKRLVFYTQDKIVELNYLLSLIDKGLRASIFKLKQPILYKQEIDLALDNIGEIEGDIIQYLKILMKLPEIAQDLRINFSMFTKGFDNFSQIFLYSDNNKLLLHTTLFYLVYYKHVGVSLYEMPPEDQELLGSIFCAYLSQQELSNRMHIRDLFSNLPNLNVEGIKLNEKDNIKQYIGGDSIIIDLDFEIQQPPLDIQSVSNGPKNPPTFTEITISVRENNLCQNYLLGSKSCFQVAEEIIRKYMGEDEYDRVRRKEYSQGFIKLLLELRIVKAHFLTNDVHFIGLQQLVFFNLTIIGANKKLYNNQNFLLSQPFNILNVYYDKLTLKNYYLEIIFSSNELEHELEEQKIAKLEKIIGIEQMDQISLVVESLTSCGALVANMLMNKLDSDFVNSFRFSFEEQIKNQWIHFLKIFEGMQSDNWTTSEQQIQFLKLSTIFLYEIDYFLTDLRKHFDDVFINEKVIQIQKKFQEISDSLVQASKNFQDKIMNKFIEYPKLSINNSIILLCLVPPKESDLAFKYLQRFLELMLTSWETLIQQIGEQIVEKIFLKLLSSVFKENIPNTTSYISQIIHREFFNKIKQQVLLNNPYSFSSFPLLLRKLTIIKITPFLTIKRFAHLILNHILYYTLEVDVQFTTRFFLFSVDEKPEEVWEIIAEIFKLLCDQRKIVFLKGFRLIKRLLEELMDIYKGDWSQIQNTKVCQVYTELCVKNTLVWGQRSGVSEHTDVIRFTYPELQRQLKVNITLLMEMIKAEDTFIINFLDNNHINYKRQIKLNDISKINQSSYQNATPKKKNHLLLSKQTLIILQIDVYFFKMGGILIIFYSFYFL